jgi:hypothetical protein
MDEQLDYAEMLEIPVSTVNVVKKKSLFGKKKDKDLKDEAIAAVNERMGDYVYAEDLSEPPAPPKGKEEKVQSKSGSRIVFAETAAVCLLAAGIFVTNILMPNSVINTFIGELTSTPTEEAAYSDFKLYPVVSELSQAVITVSDNGIISFTDECAVYPVCGGTISAIYETNGIYTVEIAHTSTFTSVISGVNTVYYAVGDSVKSEVPVCRTDGSSEVKISMYDSGTLLNCYVLSGAVPVWNS